MYGQLSKSAIGCFYSSN